MTGSTSRAGAPALWVILAAHGSRLLLQPHRGALGDVVRNLQRERESEGPFAPVRVVVPNRNVETFVRWRSASVWDCGQPGGHVSAQAAGPRGRAGDTRWPRGERATDPGAPAGAVSRRRPSQTAGNVAGARLSSRGRCDARRRRPSALPACLPAGPALRGIRGIAGPVSRRGRQVQPSTTIICSPRPKPGSVRSGWPSSDPLAASPFARKPRA